MDRRRGVRNKRGRCEIRYVRAKGEPPVSEVLPIPYTAAGVIEAAKIRQARIDYYRHGIGSPADRSNIPTFSELAQKWLDTHQMERSSRRQIRNRLNRHWMPALGHRRVDEITFGDLADVMDELAHLAPKTRHAIISAVKGVLKLAFRRGYITANPAERFDGVKVSQSIDPFTREERDKILAELDGAPRLFYVLRFYCGLRPAEAIALTWSDYDAERHELTIDKQTRRDGAAKTKNREERKVYTPPFVEDALRAYPSRFRQGHILLNGKKPYRGYEQFARAFNAALTKLGIRYRSPYNARHTCASMMLESGADPAWCARQLGHTLPMFFRVYAKLINQDRDQLERDKVAAYL